MPEAARRDALTVITDVERSEAALSEEAASRRRRAVSVANDLDAATKLRHAKEYLKSVKLRRSRDGAIFLLKDVALMYPGTEQADEAMELLAALGEEPPEAAVGAASPFAWEPGPGQPTRAQVEADALLDDARISLEVPAEIPDFTPVPPAAGEAGYGALAPPATE